MRKPQYPTKCKDCGSGEVIRVYYGKDKIQQEKDHFTVVLCAPCLQSRAQLQSMKEDKLSFPKLLAKIQRETASRVRSEIYNSSVIDMLGKYKRLTGYSKLSQYWVEQLKET